MLFIIKYQQQTTTYYVMYDVKSIQSLETEVVDDDG